MAVYYRVNSILVYQISGSEEAGFYAAAYRLVDQVQIIPIAIVGALFPLISEAAAKNPERLRRFVASAWEILLGLAFPIVAIGMVLAHPLAGLLFGAEFEGPTGTVLILIWPVVIAIFLGYLGGALVPAVNLVRVWTFIAFGGAFLCVALCLLLIPPFGANGAAIATVATEYPVMVATLWITCRRAHLRLPLGRVVRMLVAAAAGRRRGVPARRGCPCSWASRPAGSSTCCCCTDPGGGRAGAPARRAAAARHREVARLMRLVILTPYDLDTGAGGIERFTRTLVPPLERRGWSTRVIWPRARRPARAEAVEKAGAAPVAAALRTWRRHREEIADADAVLANGVMGWCVSHPRLVVVFHANFGGYAKAIRPSVSFAEYVAQPLRPWRLHGRGRDSRDGGRGLAAERLGDAPLLRRAARGRDRERHHAGLVRRRGRGGRPAAPRPAGGQDRPVPRAGGVPEGRRPPAGAAALLPRGHHAGRGRAPRAGRAGR